MTDEELAANSFKIVRVILRDEHIASSFVQSYPNIGNVIVEMLTKWSGSLPVSIEGVNSLRNFTRTKEHAQTITLANVDRTCDFVINQRGNAQTETVALQCLKNLARVPEFQQKIKVRGTFNQVV